MAIICDVTPSAKGKANALVGVVENVVALPSALKKLTLASPSEPRTRVTVTMAKRPSS